MAVQALPQNLIHQNRIDLLNFQYKEKLNKITFIAQIIAKTACFMIGVVTGALYAFPTIHLLIRFQVSSITFGAVYVGGAVLYMLGIYKLCDRWGIDAKINRLVNSFLAPYQKTYADLNNPAFIAFAHRAEALNVDTITEANQCWHEIFG